MSKTKLFFNFIADYKTVSGMDMHGAFKALAELPEKERNIIRCHYFRNMSLKQIAEIKGCTIENIRQYENRAFRKLRKNKKLISLNENFIRHDIYRSVSDLKVLLNILTMFAMLKNLSVSRNGKVNI